MPQKIRQSTIALGDQERSIQLFRIYRTKYHIYILQNRVFHSPITLLESMDPLPFVSLLSRRGQQFGQNGSATDLRAVLPAMIWQLLAAVCRWKVKIDGLLQNHHKGRFW